MTYKQAQKQFGQQFIIDKTDKPGMRQAWCIFIDELHRSGQITDKQVQSWNNPFF